MRKLDHIVIFSHRFFFILLIFSCFHSVHSFFEEENSRIVNSNQFLNVSQPAQNKSVRIEDFNPVWLELASYGVFLTPKYHFFNHTYKPYNVYFPKTVKRLNKHLFSSSIAAHAP